jgi:hypothetical protein
MPIIIGPLGRTREPCIHKSILFLFKGLRWFSKRDMCVCEIFWWSVSDLAYYISSLLIKHNRIFLIKYLPGKFSHFQQKMFWHLCIEIQFACFKIPNLFLKWICNVWRLMVVVHSTLSDIFLHRKYFFWFEKHFFLVLLSSSLMLSNKFINVFV